MIISCDIPSGDGVSTNDPSLQTLVMHIPTVVVMPNLLFSTGLENIYEAQGSVPRSGSDLKENERSIEINIPLKYESSSRMSSVTSIISGS